MVAFFATHETMLVLPLLGCAWQLFRAAPERGDHNALLIYIALAWAFASFAILLPGFAVGR